MADGGTKIQYQADTRMEIKGGGEKVSAVTPWTNTSGDRIGQVINWKIPCSSMGPPGDKYKVGFGMVKVLTKPKRCLYWGMSLV